MDLSQTHNTSEGKRLRESNARVAHWNRWGLYLSERAWGTVREDYSSDGTAWEDFPHDHARSRVYRWNEDGLAGICDRHQHICFAIALWNGRDCIGSLSGRDSNSRTVSQAFSFLVGTEGELMSVTAVEQE